MELKSYLKVIKSEKKMIIALTLLTALFAWVFSVYMPTRYETSVSLFIAKDGTQDTTEFKYAGYYALESGEIVADNIEKMLQSPQLVEKIYSVSGVDPNFKNIKGYKKKFTAKKMSNSYVEVSFETDNREDAEKLAKSLTAAVNEQVKGTASQSQNEVAFTIENTEPIIIESKPDATLNLGLGLLSGVFLGILAAFLKKYFA
ncbi:MAG: Wzz/FepE/Etk N-terminal domain-containing protein [Candidatus Pacebacteria bacterium]|jgi:capsular polysaccharide biosynthesis protein|nr:Wzz/FepE/Etk N-terminal domain-containing protein [Candidatus Paceibacterota bacterium]